jgi:uncharacterized damage-inducible protein DinB
MTPEQAVFLRDFLLGSFGNEMTTTKKVIACVPEDKSEYKSDEKSMTAKALAWHLPSVEAFFLNGVVTGQFNPGGDGQTNPTTIADILAWYDANVPALVETVKGLSGETLAEPISFFGMMTLPRVQFLNLMNHHSVHHRGQLSAYLRPMGAKVPSIYGPSADEPMK